MRSSSEYTGSTLRYADVCPRRGGRCVVDGQDLLLPADPGMDDRYPCVRRSDRGAIRAAAAAGVSFEEASKPAGPDQATSMDVFFLLIENV